MNKLMSGTGNFNLLALQEVHRLFPSKTTRCKYVLDWLQSKITSMQPTLANLKAKKDFE